MNTTHLLIRQECKYLLLAHNTYTTLYAQPTQLYTQVIIPAHLTPNTLWTYDTAILIHILLAGLLILTCQWHWAYSELDLFIATESGSLALDLVRIFGIHLTLASPLCFGYGLIHLAGDSTGLWTSDAYGLVGVIRPTKPMHSMLDLATPSFASIPANHLAAGYIGTVVGIWHISTRPLNSIHSLLGLGNLESVLASSIAAIPFVSFLVSASVWYSSITAPTELLGPSRYQWDNAYCSYEITSRLKQVKARVVVTLWDQVPDKLVLYDYMLGAIHLKEACSVTVQC